MRERFESTENGSEHVGNDSENLRNGSEGFVNGSKTPVTLEEVSKWLDELDETETKWNQNSLVVGEEISHTLLAKKLVRNSRQGLKVIVYNGQFKEVADINNGEGFDDFFNNVATSTGKLFIDIEGKQYRGEYNQGSIVINGSQGFSGLLR